MTSAMLSRPRAWLVVVAPLTWIGCGGGGPSDDTGVTSAAVTNPNDQAAFDYFRAKGLTAVQAAGIVGNLDQESNVEPTAVESGGPGRGIAQWSVGGRWDTEADDNAEWFATTEGLSVDSLELQLDFIWYELTTFPSYGLASLQAATTISAATIAFEDDFEVCGECEQSQRIAYAQTVYDAFASDPVTTTGSGSGSGSSATESCTVSTTGETGTCIDTSECASQGGVSSPDYCPGAANIQCCTTAPASSGGTTPPPPATGSGSGSGGTLTAGGCYSATLDKNVPANACVQSSSNDEWYQCDQGEWTDRWDDPTACNGIYAL
jgi:hypothetical protein